MLEEKICPYDLWAGIEPCSNRLQCLTTGEPVCLNLGSGQTVNDWFAMMRRRRDEK